MTTKHLNILVAGGFDSTDEQALNMPTNEIIAFCNELGKQIISQGHNLLTGCQTELDKIVAEAARTKLDELNQLSTISNRVISYILSGNQPSHDVGTLMASSLTDWGIGSLQLEPPEVIQKADIVILVGGFEGTFIAANWARINHKPIFPFSIFGGASKKVFTVEAERLRMKYGDNIEAIEFDKILKSMSTNWELLANQTISLAEKIVSPTDVFVIMSFADKPEYTDLYTSIKRVCNDHEYNAMRVDESNLLKRIIPEITKQITDSAFVIADITELKANVYYELGFADGLGKELILTAKAGSEIPFDVSDIPIIFWESFTDFEEALEKRVKAIGSWQGRD